MSEEIRKTLLEFSLPAYREIPDVGLYLDQSAKYINQCLNSLPDMAITTSMISNYVKHDLIDNPVRKQYGRDQIAYLLFITLIKKVLSLEKISFLIDCQKKTSDNQTAYTSFARMLKEEMQRAFGIDVAKEAAQTPQQQLLRQVVRTVCTMFYTDYLMESAREKEK